MGLRHTIQNVAGPLAMLLLTAGFGAAALPQAQQTAQPAAARAQMQAAQANAPSTAQAQTAQQTQPITSLAQAPAGRRDPFRPLVSQNENGPVPERLPPGKAGLVISTMRLDGVVRGPNGMIAVVSNPQQRVYFLRESEQVYDGQVLRITLDGITFQQRGRDAFGNPVQREVTKLLYPTPGE